MDSNQTAASIADFLKANRIAVEPDGDSAVERLVLSHVDEQGSFRKVGEIIYDRIAKEIISATGAKEIHEVVGQLASMFQEAQGIFYREQFQPIHAASDLVENSVY